MNTLHQQALEAFDQKQYNIAARNWIGGHSLSENPEELREIYEKAIASNTSTPDADLCAILGLIALDHHEIFTNDRSKALIQCIEWSEQGNSINPEHHYCLRHAGSALYWMDKKTEAISFYEKANALNSSPTLEIRIFTIKNNHLPEPDFSMLEVNTETSEAMEAYNAGVELNRLLNLYPHMPVLERKRLTELKKQCYETSYQLYHTTIIKKSGNPLNNNFHTFAMCCNNLAAELINQEDYDRAITITTEGMEYSYFMYILQNRFNAYLQAGNLEKAAEDGEQLMSDFIDDMDTITYFNLSDHLCYAYMELKRYEAAIEWINVGLESYYSMDATDSIMNDPEIVRCFTNFYINKAKAEEALGIKPDTAVASKETDVALEEMPDNPSLLISRANIFIDEGNYEKALECLQYAIHFGSEQNKVRSVQVALYNIGYLYVGKLQDEVSAFENLEQSIAIGNEDFWCYYWAVHCGYHLQENEKTVHYALLALKALPNQERVAEDIIAEIYEHLGTSQLDLGQYADATENLKASLQYNPSKIAEDNLITAEAESRRNGSSGFFKKLFGK